MTRTYTYDPARIRGGGVDQARFELGDIDVEREAALCDEEILAAIQAEADWISALCALARGVAMRLSFEADIRSDGTELKLSQRAAAWERVAARLEMRRGLARCVPRAGCADRGRYFGAGMLSNPRASGGGGRV